MAHVSTSTLAVFRRAANVTRQIETDFIPSVPPLDMCQVINIYVDPNTGKLVVLWDTMTGGASCNIASTPPHGMNRVTNIYVDPITKKLEVKYDDEGV